MHRIRLAALILCVVLTGCAAQTPYLKLDPSLQKDIRTFGGTQYMPLVRLCGAYGLDYKWDPFISTATVTKNGKRMVVRAGSDVALVNGSEKRLERPAVLRSGALFLPLSFVKANLGSIAKVPALEQVPETAVSKKFTIRTVIVDAGHGGKDPGAIGRWLRLKEKDLTLYMARKLKERLEEGGLRVIMTRTDDRFISLPKRVEIANRNNADLFVSVHVNASHSRLRSGFECYYLSDATDDNARALEAFENASLKMDEENISEHSRGLDATLWDMSLTENRLESAELATKICDSVERGLAIRNRGIRSARFYVLKGTRMPAVLVETAYISNRYEELKLKDRAFLDRLIDAVAKGVLAYKGEFEATEGYTRT